MAGFCKWWDKPLEDVTEWQQERCYEESGLECTKCHELEVKEKEDE